VIPVGGNGDVFDDVFNSVLEAYANGKDLASPFRNADNADGDGCGSDPEDGPLYLPASVWLSMAGDYSLLGFIVQHSCLLTTLALLFYSRSTRPV
jgi:hypothetical protein